MRPACCQRVAVRFYLSHGLVWVCEIELSHMGKSNGYPDLVCEKKIHIKLKSQISIQER